MNFQIRFLAILVVAILMISCSEDNSESFESDSFMRIYDNNTFSEEYSPIDMVQTPDGGYLTLATKYIPDVLSSGVYLLKSDKYGKVESDLMLDANFTNPLKSLAIKDDKIYFVCMSDDAEAKIVSAGFRRPFLKPKLVIFTCS